MCLLIQRPWSLDSQEIARASAQEPDGVGMLQCQRVEFEHGPSTTSSTSCFSSLFAPSQPAQAANPLTWCRLKNHLPLSYAGFILFGLNFSRHLRIFPIQWLQRKITPCDPKLACHAVGRDCFYPRQADQECVSLSFRHLYWSSLPWSTLKYLRCSKGDLKARNPPHVCDSFKDRGDVPLGGDVSRATAWSSNKELFGVGGGIRCDRIHRLIRFVGLSIAASLCVSLFLCQSASGISIEIFTYKQKQHDPVCCCSSYWGLTSCLWDVAGSQFSLLVLEGASSKYHLRMWS